MEKEIKLINKERDRLIDAMNVKLNSAKETEALVKIELEKQRKKNMEFESENKSANAK